MTTLYQPFEADAAQHYYSGADSYKIPVESCETADGTSMKITCDHEYVYITKAQAMAFFGLVEPEFHDGVTNPDYRQPW